MELNTIEDIQRELPDEQSARKYIANIRWGKWAKCPFCGNDKAYFIENGTRYKCANKACKKKFSVSVKTLLEGTLIPLHKWMEAVFLYSKTRGRAEHYQLQEVLGVKNERTVIMAAKKLSFAFSKAEREVGEPNVSLMNKLLINLWDYYELFDSEKNTGDKKFYAHVGDINDISNQKQYNELLTYTKWYIKHFATWVWVDFTTPQDVLSESFLALKDKGIVEYNTDLVLTTIRNTYAKMWDYYLDNSKKGRGYRQRLSAKSKSDRYEQLTYSEMVQIIKNKYNLTTAVKTKHFLKENPNLIDAEREIIIIRRNLRKIFNVGNYKEIKDVSEFIKKYINGDAKYSA